MNIRERSGHATTRDGDIVSYRVTGSGPTMLIYNGLLSTAEVHWRAWIEHYSRQYSVVTWDYRGHGDSPIPAAMAGVGIAAFADDAHDVLMAAGVERPAIVCGLSMGVQSALEHWRKYPGDIRALVLLCGTYGYPLGRVTKSAAFRKGVIAALGAAGKGGRIVQAALAPILRSRVAREIAFLTGGAHRDECPPEVLDTLFDHVSRLDPKVMLAAISSYLDHTAEDVLETIRVPALIVAGSKDQLTPPSLAEEMHARVAGSTLYVVEGHSHLAQVEKPAEVHAVTDEFLARSTA